MFLLTEARHAWSREMEFAKLSAFETAELCLPHIDGEGESVWKSTVGLLTWCGFSNVDLLLK